MYTSRLGSVLKGFIYSIAVLLGVCSLGASFGFIFKDMLPNLPIEDIANRLTYAATIFLSVEIIILPLLTIFQIGRLRSYLGYYVISLISIALYIAMWYDITYLFGKFGIAF